MRTLKGNVKEALEKELNGRRQNTLKREEKVTNEK